MSSFNAPSTAYGDNVLPFNGVDQARATRAVESAPGVFAPVFIPGDPTTGLPTGIPGGRSTASPSTSYQDALTEVQNPILLHSTSAVSVANGVIGVAGGAANDSMLVAVCILKNAGPATLTVTGFMGEDGNQRNVVFTGSTSQDTILALSGLGLRNNGGPMKLTASVADVVLVGVKPTGFTSSAVSVAPNAGSLAPTQMALLGQVVSIFPGVQRGPNVGSATLTGVAPTVAIVPAIVPSVAALTLTGIAPTLSRSIQNVTGSMVLTGTTPTLYVNGQQPLTNILQFNGAAPSLVIAKYF